MILWVHFLTPQYSCILILGAVPLPHSCIIAFPQLRVVGSMTNRMKGSHSAPFFVRDIARKLRDIVDIAWMMLERLYMTGGNLYTVLVSSMGPYECSLSPSQ
jgi:hypothetical protein